MIKLTQFLEDFDAEAAALDTEAECSAFGTGTADAFLDYLPEHCNFPPGPERTAWMQGYTLYHRHHPNA